MLNISLSSGFDARRPIASIGIRKAIAAYARPRYSVRILRAVMNASSYLEGVSLRIRCTVVLYFENSIANRTVCGNRVCVRMLSCRVRVIILGCLVICASMGTIDNELSIQRRFGVGRNYTGHQHHTAKKNTQDSLFHLEFLPFVKYVPAACL